ncbi:MAG TPA: VOC family protein [Bacteroidia bacterium]|nr:VOC family protein [Bacteroidia bacterium]
MESKILGLRTAIYKVADIKKATEWYKKVFEIAPYFNEPFYVGFNIGGYELGLQPAEKPVSEKEESVITYWGAKDVNTEYQRFIASGAVKHEAPQDVGGGIIVATVKDPWGNIIGLIYNPHFKLS